MPANTIARLVPDQRAAGAEPVTARATLRWPNHPRVVCAADKLADCGHVSIIARGGRGFNRLKQWRGIATRYDKYALTFLGGVLLAASILRARTAIRN